MTPSWFSGFVAQRHGVNGVQIHARVCATARGDRPALLLLHGFPQTHVMWQRVAQLLQSQFFLVLPDLRGYGDSSLPPGVTDHSMASKRAMAQDLVELMARLDAPQFLLCGHDRGGRVAHRLALDHPQRVSKLCLIDIAPTLDMYSGNGLKRSYMEFARAYEHWFHLVQPAPLPERMILGCARDYLHAKLGGWGAAGLAHIEPAALAEYERCFMRPEAIHSACEDYRASIGIDLAHDQASRAQGQLLRCPTHVLWGARGVVDQMFDPLALWQAQCAAPVTGQAMPAGHFIPEELPEATAEQLREFFGRA